jgi:hypothetical protein
MDPLSIMKRDQLPQNPFAAKAESPKSTGSEDQAYFRKVQISQTDESAFIEIKK